MDEVSRKAVTSTDSWLSLDRLVRTVQHELKRGYLTPDSGETCITVLLKDYEEVSDMNEGIHDHIFAKSQGPKRLFLAEHCHISFSGLKHGYKLKKIIVSAERSAWSQVPRQWYSSSLDAIASDEEESSLIPVSASNCTSSAASTVVLSPPGAPELSAAAHAPAVSVDAPLAAPVSPKTRVAALLAGAAQGDSRLDAGALSRHQVDFIQRVLPPVPPPAPSQVPPHAPARAPSLDAEPSAVDKGDVHQAQSINQGLHFALESMSVC